MIVHGERKIGPQAVSPEIVWRNPLPHMQACLRAREANNPYCRWAEQGSKIRARRSNWDIRNNWAE
jgi:hypothetical protein